MGLIDKIGRGFEILGSAVEGIGKAGFKTADHIGNQAVNIARKETVGKIATAIGIGAVAGGMLADSDNQDIKKGAVIGGSTVGAGVYLGSSLGLSVAGAVTTLGASAIGVGTQIGVAGISLASSAIKMPEGPILQNLSKTTLKPWAVPIVLGSALVGGTKDAVRTFERSRMGTNDGRLRTATPDIPIQSQNNYSVNRNGGIDFSNTGASGDLVFAMR